ncbi:MAG: hypothetical protein AB1750_01165, partial [Chloroflexota bacterium]
PGSRRTGLSPLGRLGHHCRKSGGHGQNDVTLRKHGDMRLAKYDTKVPFTGYGAKLLRKSIFSLDFVVLHQKL